MNRKVIEEEKTKKAGNGFSNISLSVDKKKMIDSSFGYVICNNIDFDSKSKTIILS